MNDFKEKVQEHYKALNPLSSILLKLFLPVLGVLFAAVCVLGAAYLFTGTEHLYDVLLDCAEALKGTAGIGGLSLVIARVLK